MLKVRQADSNQNQNEALGSFTIVPNTKVIPCNAGGVSHV